MKNSDREKNYTSSSSEASDESETMRKERLDRKEAKFMQRFYINEDAVQEIEADDLLMELYDDPQDVMQRLI